MANLDYARDKFAFQKYAVSKAGNVLHALQFRNLYEKEGIVSVSLNPGNLSSELTRHAGLFGKLVVLLLTYPPVNGAYTEFFAGLAPEVKNLKQNEWVIPFGRVASLRKDVAEAGREGGKAEEFWAWSDDQVKAYLLITTTKASAQHLLVWLRWRLQRRQDSRRRLFADTAPHTRSPRASSRHVPSVGPIAECHFTMYDRVFTTGRASRQRASASTRAYHCAVAVQSLRTSSPVVACHLRRRAQKRVLCLSRVTAGQRRPNSCMVGRPVAASSAQGGQLVDNDRRQLDRWRQMSLISAEIGNLPQAQDGEVGTWL
ncbi:hypothetical protein OPT61_g10651 [Boeremia exigua]|uniref:Uncharacterized protein n=1 Tax=Boeremia exigua TaxID=749465 RepID=A0ACC2HPE8_9PLEO|nr:hypothetical protein OPT61_g10651 [Boeremia exigua]